MTDGTSHGLFITVAIVIFGIFVVLAYILFEDTLSPALANMFTDSSSMVSENINIAKYYDEDVVPNAESDFIFDEATGMILDYIGVSKDVVIPYQIDGVMVTALGKISFAHKGLNSVIIPNTVTTLEHGKHWSDSENSGVFKGNNLTSIKIPSSIKHIGIGAFADNQLTSIQLPKGLLTIEMDAFRNNKLTKIDIPNTVTFIGQDTFEMNEIRELTIPGSVKELGYCAFNINKIEKLTLHEGLKIIGSNAFSSNQIQEVHIPKSVNLIRHHAFDGNVKQAVLHRDVVYDTSSTPSFHPNTTLIFLD